jgi:hypothetical protein
MQSWFVDKAGERPPARHEFHDFNDVAALICASKPGEAFFVNAPSNATRQQLDELSKLGAFKTYP